MRSRSLRRRRWRLVGGDSLLQMLKLSDGVDAGLGIDDGGYHLINKPWRNKLALETQLVGGWVE